MTKTSFSFLLLALYIALYLLPLGVRPLFIQDETRYAEVPREILITGDWIVPRINGLRYFEKPVMGYWLTSVSLMLFGENNFAVRLPSALATGLVALLLFLLSSHCCRYGSRIPRLTILIYLTSLGVAAIGTFAVLDTSLTLFLTATLICFFLATEERSGSGKEHILLFLSGLFAGCAFLTKGFLAFAVPVLVAIPYLLAQGRFRDILRMLWLPVVGAVLVSLPWAILIHQREPDFWHYFFWNEHVRRFLSDSAQHIQPFWFFSAVLPAMFMPWFLLLPAAVIGLREKQWTEKLEYRLGVFCLCWFLFPFLFFSASSGKLITYILPCFPPLAILFAQGLDQIPGTGKVKSVQLGIGAAVLLASFALLALLGLQLFGPDQWRIFQRSWKWLLLGNGLAAMLVLLVVAFRIIQGQSKIILFACAFALLFLTAHFVMPTLTLNMKAPEPLIVRHGGDISPQTYVLSGGEAVRAVCWYLKREDVYLVERAGELEYGLNAGDSQHRLLSPTQAGQLIRSHPGQVVLIAAQEEYSRWQPFLPSPVSVDSSGSKGYLLLQY